MQILEAKPVVHPLDIRRKRKVLILSISPIRRISSGWITGFDDSGTIICHSPCIAGHPELPQLESGRTAPIICVWNGVTWHPGGSAAAAMASGSNLTSSTLAKQAVTNIYFICPPQWYCEMILNASVTSLWPALSVLGWLVGFVVVIFIIYTYLLFICYIVFYYHDYML